MRMFGGLAAGLARFPSRARLQLTLQEERRFGNGMVYLQYLCVNLSIGRLGATWAG
jgi:hypothetical protein